MQFSGLIHHTLANRPERTNFSVEPWTVSLAVLLQRLFHFESTKHKHKLSFHDCLFICSSPTLISFPPSRWSICVRAFSAWAPTKRNKEKDLKLYLSLLLLCYCLLNGYLWSPSIPRDSPHRHWWDSPPLRGTVAVSIPFMLRLLFMLYARIFAFVSCSQFLSFLDDVPSHRGQWLTATAGWVDE